MKVRVSPIFARFKAFVIDMFIIFMPILYFVTYAILGSKESFLNSQLSIFLCNITFALILALFFYFKAQSPGYKAQDLYLLDIKTGKKLSFFRIIFRYICFIISGFCIVGLLLAFFRKDRLNLHDILSRSCAFIRS